ARQRGEIFGRRRARDRLGGGADPRYRLGARAGSRHRHPAQAAEADLQPLLPGAGPRAEGQGHRPRPLHCPFDRARARGQGLRRQRGRRPRRHVHDRASPSGAVTASIFSTASTPPRHSLMGRILIVEDEAHIADGLRYNLEAEGHLCEVAHDGENALTRVLKDGQPFDAIVLDVMLPGKDGFAVATELRAAHHYEPILMLTALGRPEDVLKGFEAGADDYLPKPFELPILIARVNGLLRRRRWNEG